MLKVIYTTDGIQKEFPFPHRIFKDENLTVFLEEIQMMTGFVIENEDSLSGANVVFNVAPESGKELTLMRQMQIKRTSDFQPQNPLDLTILNVELDYQIETLKDISAQLSKTVSQGLISNELLNLTLPVPEAGKALLWSPTADSLVNSEINISQTILDLETDIAEMERLNNDIRAYLEISGDAGILGIVNNLIGLMASYHVDAFITFGHISDSPDENPAYGLITESAGETIDYT
ncbi:MAG: hypothetical protein JW812_03590 [Alphaproteobacteria bacterium]|nr:hypothetical protein [Alphaproteobacteria bacterium]MBN2779935.1 hypothetical protein [Alphaproteobacteria bacterium]